jgi:hypothetical protein
MKSDIFDEYAKIAEAQGLIQKDAFFNSDEYKKKIEDNGGRAGSDDISTIEALYGKKKDKKDKSIIEEAHPETIVVSPAYDAFNGVVENEQERQNISINIALRPPNGNINTRRYVKAKQELVDALIRVGFLMDNKNEDQIMKLADSCSSKLVMEKKIVKTAFQWGDLLAPLGGMLSGAGTGAIIGGGIPGAIVGGLIGLIGATGIVNHISPADQGVINNGHNALQRLSDALEETPKIAKLINPLIKDMLSFLALAENVENASPVAVDKNNLAASINKLSEQDKQNLNKSMQYAVECNKLSQELAPIISTLDTVKPEEMNVAPGLDYLANLTRGLVGNKINDAVHALSTFKDSLDKAAKEVNSLLTAAKSSAQKIEEQSKEQPKEGLADGIMNKAKELTNDIPGGDFISNLWK